MLQWFHRLMPRQNNFFPLFERHATVLVAGAAALAKMLETGEQIDRQCAEVLEQEHRADDIAREVLIAVRTTFVTPFDRADIQGLISSMDDTIDQMQKTAKAIILFEMTAFEPEMREMTGVIVESAELVQRAVPLLSDIANNVTALNETCIQITRLEGRADEMHDRGLKRLYEKAKAGNALDFLRGKEIYDHLEECADRFDDVANKIQGIVIEQV